jgi:hypothetical protein
VIAFTSIAANLIAISGGILVFHDSIGVGAAQIVGRTLAFCLAIAGAALMPAPTRAPPEPSPLARLAGQRTTKCWKPASASGRQPVLPAASFEEGRVLPTKLGRRRLAGPVLGCDCRPVAADAQLAQQGEHLHLHAS